MEVGQKFLFREKYGPGLDKRRRGLYIMAKA
jgi:hypothetical protein